MAEWHDAGSDPAQTRAATLGTLTNITGAVLSLALVAGVGVWGYKLIMRDVSGVPVVRAVEGPMRVAPEDPGGQAADHQGLSVNAVAAEGVAAAPADRLILAPPPLDLTLEDVPRAKAAVKKMAEVSPAAEAGEATPDDAPEALQQASVQALADLVSADAAPLSPLEGETATDEDVTQEPEQTRVEGAISRSLRPRLRPDVSQAVAVAVATARDTASEAAEVDPAAIPDGTRLAQLGAYESAEIAREEWGRLETRFEDFLDGKRRVIQKAESGGRTFYRLRAMGFADLGEARRFCSALVAERADCIPVVTR
ncbi:hypothetical protein ACSSV4_003539 [Roseovarius sp. MBR-154]|jgi:hypothetical protein